MPSKLNKIAQKIFASTPGVNQISKFGSLAAGSPEFTTDANAVQSMGNFLTGWFGAIIGGASPAIEDMNGLHYLTTRQIAYLMQAGIPEWDAATEYFVGSIVNVAGIQFVSKTDNNINHAVTDTTNWRMTGGGPVGTGSDFWGTTLPAGYIWASGKTIGNLGSGATERADADTFDLYSMFWSGYTDALLPMFTSAGAASGRGSSAAADFAAGKTITVIDKRSRVSVGKGNMGGTDTTRITNFDAKILGNSGGLENHVLTIDQMPSHTHIQDAHDHTLINTVRMNIGYDGQVDGGSVSASPADGVIENRNVSGTTAVNNYTGGGSAHNNMQPSIICNYIIKL